jgi:hypothetical protein
MAQCPQRLPDPPTSGGSPAVVLVGQLHRGSFEAIRFARTIASDLVAVHMDLGLGKVEAFKEQWARQVPDVHLEILDSPYRSLVGPVVDFVKDFEVEHRKDRNRFCVVVLPVFVTRHRWENLLHAQSTGGGSSQVLIQFGEGCRRRRWRRESASDRANRTTPIRPVTHSGRCTP